MFKLNKTKNQAESRAFISNFYMLNLCFSVMCNVHVLTELTFQLLNTELTYYAIVIQMYYAVYLLISTSFIYYNHVLLLFL